MVRPVRLRTITYFLPNPCESSVAKASDFLREARKMYAGEGKDDKGAIKV